MRQLDKVATALAGALGYSTKYNEGRLKVICNGADKNAQEMVVIVECRIRARKTPEEDSENTNIKKKPGGLKPTGKPKTPHKSLMQTLAKLEKQRE